MKKKKFLSVLFVSILIVSIFSNTILAASNTSSEEEEIYTMIYTMFASEWEEPDESIYLEEDGEKVEYMLTSFEYTESETNTKAVTQTVTKEDLTSNSESYIRETFGETYYYSDEEGYSGTLTFANYEVTTVDQGNYEQIESLDVSFTNYTMNDLNNISKTYLSSGYTWYLINVDWEVQTAENIDGMEVPIYYQGIMHYQRVATYSNPDHYNIAVTYEGDVTTDDLLYDVIVEYTKIKQEAVEEVIVEETEETSYIPQIIISGLAIVLIIVLFIIFSKNAKIYNKQTNGNYKLIKRARISNRNSYAIELDNVNYKINTNLYMLKLNKSRAKKFSGTTVTINKGGSKVYVKLNGQIETEFKI